MRRFVLSTVLALGLPVVALASQADALPGLTTAVPRAVHATPVGHGGNTVVRRATGVTHAASPRHDNGPSRAQKARERRRALVARWQGVADCESGGDWQANTGNGYYGGLQFSLQTWRAYGGPGMPNEQPAWKQSQIAERVRDGQGLGAWPNCGRYYRG